MQQQKLFLILLVFFTTIFSSCLNSRKLDRQVSKQYGSLPEARKKKQPDNIKIVSPLTTGSDQISTTETKTSKMLPLLVYWQWDYKNTCTLNPQIPINKFSA